VLYKAGFPYLSLYSFKSKKQCISMEPPPSTTIKNVETKSVSEDYAQFGARQTST
jgi:hypothetical protein